MPTDTKPFYRHILGTHWKDKPNKGLDVKVKKKSAIFFESQAASHNRAAVSLNSGTGSAETSQNGALCSQGNRFAVVPSQYMGVQVQLTHRYCIAACGTPNMTDRCQEKNQRPGISAPIPMRGGKKRPERFKHTCSRIVQRFDMHPMATAVTRRFKHRRKLRWRGYTFARNRWRRQSEELLHYAR